MNADRNRIYGPRNGAQGSGPYGNLAALADTSSRGDGSVRRYTMTKKARNRWLGRYMSDSQTVSPKNFSAQKKAGAGENDGGALREKAGKLLFGFILTVALGLILFITGTVLSRMTLDAVRVEGGSTYTGDELLAASGLSYGDNLILGRIKAGDPKESLPLLEDCSISLDLPGTLVFTVRESVPEVYTEIAGSYYSLSPSLRVIERSDSPETFASAGLVYVSIPRTSSATAGSKLELAGGADSSYISGFLGVLSESGVLPRVSRIFLEEKYGAVITLDGRYRIIFGTPSDARLKLDTALRVISEADDGNAAGYTVDVSDPAMAGVRKLESFDPDLRLESVS